MPKKGGKQTRAEKEAQDESHKPAGITLSNFIVLSPKPKQSPQTDEHTACLQQNCAAADAVSAISTAAGGNKSCEDNSSPSGQPDAPPKPAFRIKRTKKGNLPITYESRAKGKKVTVISNVSGDASGLLSMLKKATGTGGVAKGEMVELQGDHRKFLETYLKKHPCLH